MGKSTFAVSSCAIALGAIVASGSAQEFTVNGGFETGDTSGWVSFPTPNSTFDITGDANNGSFAGEVFNDDPVSGAVVKQANIGVGIVSPGDMLTISFAAKGSSAAGGVAFAEFFSELDGGGVSSAEILSGGPLTLTDTYQTFNFTAVAGPDVSGGVTLQFAAVTGGDVGSVSALFIDDVSVTPTTAPPLTGACCLNGCCIESTSAACAAAGGSYLGDGVACTEGSCQTCEIELTGDVPPFIDVLDLLAFLEQWFPASQSGTCP